MNCKTCGIEGHDSQGSKELCLVAVVSRCQRMELENGKLKGMLKAIVDPLLAADEARDKDAHMFCVCLLCMAWALYENEPLATLPVIGPKEPAGPCCGVAPSRDGSCPRCGKVE